jgi:hypothetical protein
VIKVLFDMDANPAIGFKPIWSTLRSGLTRTAALTSIHSFSFALVQSNPALAEPVRAILGNQKIALPTDAYGASEANFSLPE